MKIKSENYTIGALAKFYGVSTDTIRLYDRKGILISQKNDENNYRVYSRDDMIAMDFIIKLRQMGIPLNDVKHITGEFTIPEIHDYTINKLNHIENEIDRLTAIKQKTVNFMASLEKIQSDMDIVSVRRSPIFILRDIKDGVAAAYHSIECLGLGTMPMLAVLTESQFAPENMVLVKQTKTRDAVADFYVCQEDDQGIVDCKDFPAEEFLVFQPALCIHTVTKAVPNLEYEFHYKIKEYADKHNYKLSGQCLCRVLLQKSKGIYCADYYECWYFMDSD